MKLTYTATEAAEILGVSRGLIYSMVKSGELKSLTLGRRVLITRVVLEELLGTPIPDDETVS